MTATYCWLYESLPLNRHCLIMASGVESVLRLEGHWGLGTPAGLLKSATQPKFAHLDSLEVEEWLSAPTEEPSEDATATVASPVDSEEAPEGYYAVAYAGTCEGCVFDSHYQGCLDAVCSPRNRQDGQSVKFKAKGEAR